MFRLIFVTVTLLFGVPVFAFNCLNTNPLSGNVQNMSPYSNFASPLSCSGGDLSGFRAADMVIYKANLDSVALLKTQVSDLTLAVSLLSSGGSVAASGVPADYSSVVDGLAIVNDSLGLISSQVVAANPAGMLSGYAVNDILLAFFIVVIWSLGFKAGLTR